MLSLLLLNLGCTPDFEETRTDLVEGSFRVLGAGVRDGKLAVAAWSGDPAGFETALDVVWRVDGVALDDSSAPPAPFTAEATVTYANQTERVLLDVAADATPLSIAAAARAQGDAGWTLALDVPGAVRTRWAHRYVDLTPTGPTEALLEVREGADGLAMVFALALDERGGAAWTWFDVPTPQAGLPLLAVGSRLLPVDVLPTTPGPWLATIDAPSTYTHAYGFELTALEPAGTERGALSCASPSGTLDAEALIDGRCGRDDVLGQRVRVEGAPW